MDIPVFIINGFLEAGKTNFISETVCDPEFSQGDTTLLIVCEEGEEEYDEVLMKKNNVVVEYVDSPEEFTSFYFKNLNSKYKPQRVMIEYNGTWEMEHIFEADMPRKWIIVQVISIVNALTFENYFANMRAIMTEQMSQADTIIFNRCDENTKRAAFRRSIKVMNRKAQIIYEGKDGILGDDGEEDLPFDINADVIELSDDDYGLWYIDAMDNPRRYDGKIIKYTAMVFKPKNFPPGYFVPGRMAMTCCADDIQMIGFICQSDKADRLKNKEWIKIVCEVKCENHKAYKGEGPMLYAKKIEYTSEPEDKLVYFT